MKRKLTLVLALLLCLTPLFQTTAQAEPDENFNETGFPIVNETVTLNFFAPHNTAVEDYYTNTFVTEYEKMTNVHIEWELVPPAGLTEKKTLLFASNDLPDAFFGSGISTQEVVRYSAEGMLLPIEELIEKYNPEIKSMYEQLPAIKDLLVAPDGHTYQYPSVSHCYHCFYPHKFWINTKWMDNLGLSMPTTTDELYDVLKAFKEQDANGNGDPNDEIPMSASMHTSSWSSYPHGWIMNAFIFDPRDNHVNIVDGKLDFSPANPAYKEGMKYLAKLYAEKLIDQDCFTQEFDAVRQKMQNVDVSLVGAAPCMHYLALVGIDGERPTEYDSVPPLAGPEGYKSSFYDPYGLDRGKFVLSVDCAYPEVASRWIDYFYTEEGLLAQKYGVENQEWYHPAADSGEMGHGEGLDAAPARFNWMPGKGWTETQQNVTLNQQGPIFEPREFRGAWTNDPASPLEPRLIAATKPYEGTEQKEFWTDLIMLTQEEQEEMTPIQQQLFRYVDEMVAKFMTGEIDVDAGWDAYVQELKNMGMDRFIELRQGAYDRFTSK